MMLARAILTVTTVAGVCAAPAALAQVPEPAGQVPPGLFGKGPSRSDQSLDVNLSLIGAYDDNVVPFVDEPVVDALTRQSGVFGGVNATTTYVRRWRSVTLVAGERSLFRYYPDFGDTVGMQHLASAGLAIQGKRTQVGLTQTFGYSPFFAFAGPASLVAPRLGALPAAVADQTVTRSDGRVYDSLAEVNQSLGGRMTLRLSASRRRTDAFQQSVRLGTDAVGGRLTRHLTPNLGLVAGYRYDRGVYQLFSASPQVTRLHSLDLGVDYARALSVTRRITFAFATGSAAVQDVRGATEYRVVGNARLTREIGRTWSATGAYYRGIGFVEGFEQPFFADTVGVDVRGFLSPRVELFLAGSYSKGELGLAGGSNRHETVNTAARLRVALSRHAAVSAESVMYRYRFDHTSLLPASIPPTLERYGVRVGLDFWLPVVR